MKRIQLSISAALLLFSFPVFSAEKETDEIKAGHSSHGEVFNEGPRQAAVLIPGTGDVKMEVTTISGEAQKFFNQGLGQLHGFWDFEAERSFRQVAAIDPDCAMAYWGMAMANFKNDTRGKGFIEKASALRDKASPHEQMWIDGLAAYYKDPKLDLKKRLRELVRSLEKIAAAHPDDIEAQAFLLKQIYYNNGKGLTIPSHFAINLLAEKILASDPDHPANHYQIHLWDKEKPANALKAAGNCGPAAPGIAHMWHMPGHIYSKLHRYTDASWQQEASARIDHGHMIRFQIVPDRIHNFSHNNEWLIRNLNNTGEVNRSIELATNMVSLPRLAKFTKKGDESTYEPKNSSWYYGRIRLRDTLVRFELWEQLISQSENHLLKPDEKSIKEIDFHRFVGIAKFETGNVDGGKSHLDKLQTLLAKEETDRDKAVKDAEAKAKKAGKNEKDTKSAKAAAEKNFKTKITSLENPVKELQVYAALTKDQADKEAALKLLPDLKNLAKARHAMLWHRAGNSEKAIETVKSAVSSGDGEVLPLLAQIKILHANGKKDEAKAAFSSLQKIAHSADVTLPVFAALNPIAKDLGLGEKWQTPKTPATDLGKRPPLDSLGPFRWSPPKAPNFELSDSEGKVTTLSSFSGKPVLVIFYLGRGCPHCIEQLQDFAPAKEKYAKAGIEMIAISTDSPDGLAKTFLKTEEKENPYPFPLLSDQSLKTFKAYRAFDDFEDTPLHGTFLIDGQGQIRWQNISFEPFMYPNWLLEECQRLLDYDKSNS